jgi:hypothetical protein
MTKYMLFNFLMSQSSSSEKNNRDDLREKIVKNQINYSLQFDDPADEKLYHESLKNHFHFPTFWPIIAVFVALFTFNGRFASTLVNENNTYFFVGLGFTSSTFILIIFYLLSHLALHIEQRLKNSFTLRAAKSFLRNFLHGHVEDAIIICVSLAQGFNMVFIIDTQVNPETALTQRINCENDELRFFPTFQAFFAYSSVLLLTIYFKSMHRYAVLSAWFILTAFIIVGYLFGDFAFSWFAIIHSVFWFLSIYELERFKMTSFMLSKDALVAEKEEKIRAMEKSKLLESKLNTALVHQMLPPKVVEQIIAGKEVKPELFEEVINKIQEMYTSFPYIYIFLNSPSPLLTFPFFPGDHLLLGCRWLY